MLTFLKNPITRLFISVLLFATAVGIDMVTFPTILMKNGINPAKIGISFSFEVIGGLLMSLVLSRLAKKIGVVNFLGRIVIIYAAAIAVIFFCKNFYLWLLIVFGMGACWVAYTVIRQALLNMLVANKSRGMIIGLYSMIVSAGLAVGPIIVKFTGADNYLAFIIAAIIVIISFYTLDRSKEVTKLEISAQNIHFFTFVKDNPLCFLARFLVDFELFCFLNFSVVFGKKIGLSPENAGLLITAFTSSFFVDVFVGAVLKKFNPYKMIASGFIGYLLGIIIIALYREHYELLLVVYFFLGIFGAFIYIAAVMIVNQDYKKEELIPANAALQTVGSLGALCGGFFGGILMQIFGANGFILTIVVSCLVYLIFYVLYEKRKNSARS